MMRPTETTKFRDFIESLMVDFNSSATIPYDASEVNWRDVVDIIAGSSEFSNRGIPQSAAFSNWLDWGIITYGLIAR